MLGCLRRFCLSSLSDIIQCSRAVTWRPYFILIIWPKIDSWCHYLLKFNPLAPAINGGLRLLFIFHLSLVLTGTRLHTASLHNSNLAQWLLDHLLVLFAPVFFFFCQVSPTTSWCKIIIRGWILLMFLTLCVGWLSFSDCKRLSQNMEIRCKVYWSFYLLSVYWKCWGQAAWLEKGNRKIEIVLQIYGAL